MYLTSCDILYYYNESKAFKAKVYVSTSSLINRIFKLQLQNANFANWSHCKVRKL
jgi:hypothetical protein